MQALQLSLLVARDRPGPSGAPIERRWIGEGAWLDVARGWWAGSDSLLAELDEAVRWERRRRWMYDRMVDEPRSTSPFRRLVPEARRPLDGMRHELERHYGVELAAPFLNYYESGRDSVAFHSDRELRDLDDTIVAIVTLGAARPFLIRPKAGGRSIDLRPASGDLLVMGGRCQADFEHAVPKVRAAGPRLSVSMRWSAKGIDDSIG